MESLTAGPTELGLGTCSEILVAPRGTPPARQPGGESLSPAFASRMATVTSQPWALAGRTSNPVLTGRGAVEEPSFGQPALGGGVQVHHVTGTTLPFAWAMADRAK